MASEVHHYITVSSLRKYEVTLHGPYPKSSVPDSPDFEKSQKFEKVQLTYPIILDSTDMTIQGVMKVWVAMNLANQEFVRAQAQLDTIKKPICQLLIEQHPAALRFQQAFNRVQKTVKDWQPYVDAGYKVTIIK
ncbi:hypothetical protein [Simkania sp.]|uniref:hypothetical protein n=1 Tax=Simkania sp. TaxID=34094 RepID=UPI003B523A65